MEKLFDETTMTKKELFQFLVDNKNKLIARKKAQIKHADGFMFASVSKVGVTKADGEGDLTVKAVINTTNFMDSHSDVHLPGIWTKSLQENDNVMHLQEHRLEFSKIIADGEDLKAYPKTYTWKELGYKYEGNTQALIFDSRIKKDRNPYMYDQYRKGNVKNHSVGMMYVKIILAVNDEEYAAEYDAWQKYYPEIANKEVADEQGYFWAVKEAKVIEGSAVPIGSNTATPTLITEAADKGTSTEPPEGTQFKEYLQTIKLF